MSRKYDSTVARIAGNIIGHLAAGDPQLEGLPYIDSDIDVRRAVELARLIVAEVERTEPAAKMGDPL